MEKLKNDRFNLEKQRPTFFWIGMVLSLLLVIAAFEWRSEYDTAIIKRGETMDVMDEVVLITKHEEPKPPKPKKTIIAPNPIETDEIDDLDSIELVIDLEDMTDEKLDDLIDDIADEVDNSVYFPGVIEAEPMPVGGYAAFYQFVASNVKYPAEAQRLGVEGKVYIQFIIDKNGSITALEVMRGVGAGCDEEALRVLSLAPAWTPGKQRGKPVKVRMVLPITFKLN